VRLSVYVGTRRGRVERSKGAAEVVKTLA
jgi:hypothetical protein